MSLRRRVLALIGTCAVVSLGLLAPAGTAYAAVDSGGQIEVYGTPDNRVRLSGWPEPATVDLFVDGDYYDTYDLQPGDDPGSWGLPDFTLSGVSLTPGSTVTFRDQTDTYYESVTVSSVGIDTYDFAHGTFAGWGTPGRHAHYCTSEAWADYRPDPGCQFFVVGPDGRWSVTFETQMRATGVHMAFSEIDENGNNINAGSRPYAPYLAVSYPNAVQAVGWHHGALLTVTATAPDGTVTTAEQTAGFDETWFEELTLVRGTTVKVTDGVTAHVVRVDPLPVTVDPDADTVSGEAWGDVEAIVPTPDGDVVRHVASDGGFTVAFGVPGDDGDYDEDMLADIAPDTIGAIRRYDTDFDYTESQWNVTAPAITVEPATVDFGGQWVHVRGTGFTGRALVWLTEGGNDFDPEQLMGEVYGPVTTEWDGTFEGDLPVSRTVGGDTENLFVAAVDDVNREYATAPISFAPIVTLHLTTGAAGTLATATGRATVGGTIASSVPAWVHLEGSLTQRLSKNKLATGQFDTWVWATPSPTTWSVVVVPGSVLFASGQALLEASAYVAIEQDEAYVQASGYVTLKTAKRK